MLHFVLYKHFVFSAILLSQFCPPVCHTGDSRLNGSVHRNNYVVHHTIVTYVVYSRPNFAVQSLGFTENKGVK